MHTTHLRVASVPRLFDCYSSRTMAILSSADMIVQTIFFTRLNAGALDNNINVSMLDNNNGTMKNSHECRTETSRDNCGTGRQEKKKGGGGRANSSITGRSVPGGNTKVVLLNLDEDRAIFLFQRILSGHPHTHANTHTHTHTQTLLVLHAIHQGLCNKASWG